MRIRLTEANGALGDEYRVRTPIPRDVTIGDADNDGRNELVLIESTTNRIKVYRWAVAQKAQATALDFGSVRLIPLPKDENPDKRDFAVGDMDGDGLPDLLVTDPTTARMTIVRSVRGKGLGAAESFPSLQEATRVVVATLGRQGPPSAFLISKKEGILGVSRYDKNTGRLTYPQPIELPGKPQEMAVRPAGKDGPEALVCIVEMEKGKDDKKARLEIVVVEAAEEGYRVAARQEAPGLDEAPLRLMAVDVNADGRSDLLALRTYQPAALLVQNADGKFEDVTAGPQFRKHILRGLAPASVAMARLRRDEQPLMVVCSENLARAVAYENGNLVVKDQYSSPNANADFKAVHVADLDGDGASEVLLFESKSHLLCILKRNAKGVFEPAEQVEVGPFTVMGLLREDIDGDKVPEVLIVGRENVGVMSVGSVTELSEVASIEADEEDEAVYAQVLVSDLNADGKNDLALRDVGQNQLEIFARTAEGKWVSGMRFKVFETRGFERAYPGMPGGQGGGDPRELVAADVTGDGLTDMAIITHDRVIVYPQQK